MRSKVISLELSEGIKPIPGLQDFAGLYFLVRYKKTPIGFVILKNEMSEETISVNQIRESITRQIGWALVRAVLGSKFRPVMNANVPIRPVSVIVCTRDRALQLDDCLQALLSLDYLDYEIIVVDNAPSDDATAKLVAGFPVRYVREDRPGLNWARNRGIAEAKYDLVAFIDDDARPERDWLHFISAAFSDSAVMAVTGLIVPAELETRAQSLFEFSYGGMGKGFRRRFVNGNALTTQELLWANAFGVGTNMAFRRLIFNHIGPFDVELDVGTPSGGGGDLEMFHRLLARGYTLLYEPSALVWHFHKREIASFRKLLFNNGRGFGAYLLTCARKGTVGKKPILIFAMRNWLGGWLTRQFMRPKGMARHMVMIEFFGALLSPLFYGISRIHGKRHGRASGDNSLPLLPPG